jgi:aldose 1-epimerase|nr:MAG: aldose epimerase [Actinomycetota bacterium]
MLVSSGSLRCGDLHAEISTRGGALRVLRAGERDLIVSWPEDGPIPFYSGTLLAPWPNRIADAVYTFAGERFELPVTEPERGHALHGLVTEAPWEFAEPVSGEEASARLTHTIEPTPGYPFRLALEVLYTLTPDGLTTTLTAQNIGDRPAPYGCGPHPWLLAGDGPVDGWELELPASRVLLVDERLVPRELTDVAGTPYDFRSPRLIGGTAIDHAFTGLAADAEGLARVRLRGPAGGVEVRWDPRVLPWVQVCTGTGLGHRGLAVEPMTCPPDAFNSGTDVVVLQPGEKHEASWTIAPL